MSWIGSKAYVVLGLLLLALPAAAQLRLDGLTMSADGIVGAGYDGGSASNQASSHDLGFNASGDLTGFYFNPKFLSFSVVPNYNRSQANSGSGSLTNSTDFDASVQLFGGSQFPIALSYNKAFDSSGFFGLPGVQGFVTHGDTTTFSVTGTAQLAGLPPLSAFFSHSSSSSTIFGTSHAVQGSSRVFGLNSTYRLAGWGMSGRFTDVTNQIQVPSFLSAVSGSGSDITTNDSIESTKTLSFSATHRLPLHGSAQLGYAYSSYSGGTEGDHSSGSNSILSGDVSIYPKRWISSSFEAEYNSNLTGLVEQQLANTGNVGTQVNLGTDTHELSLSNFNTLSLYKGVGLGVSVSHTQESAFGQSISSNHFAAVLNYHYIKPLWGSLTIYGGVVDQSNETGHEGTGATGGADFSRWIHGFDISAGFGYDQEVETVLATQFSSSYTYLASAKRRFGRNTLWNTTFSGFHSGLGQAKGSSSHSESYGTSLTYKRYAASATYSKSFGTALFTPTGLVSVPGALLPVLSNNQLILDNASGYSLSLSAGILPRSTINVSYGSATTSTTTPGLVSSNTSQVFSIFSQYQLRSTTITAGYSRIMQGVSASNLAPVTFTNYSIGIQRWFKAF